MIGELTIEQQLFKIALRIRMVELRISEDYKNWKMRCPVHLSVGQEGVSAAFALLQQKDDYVVSTHRAHAHYLAKGGDLNSMIAEIFGKITGCSKGRGGSMHLIDKSVNFMGSSAIVGNSIPVGVGLGYHIKANNEEALSFVFLGDGAVEEGSFYESASFAVLKNLPVIFVCENNGYSVYTNLLSRQKKINTIEDTARGIGLEYLKSDGNNAVEAFNSMKFLIERSKTLNRPGFIELATSRKFEHCGPDIDHFLNYRTPNEIQELENNDPLRILRDLMTRQGDVIIDEWIAGLEKQFQIEIDQAFNLASRARFPTLKEVTSN